VTPRPYYFHYRAWGGFELSARSGLTLSATLSCETKHTMTFDVGIAFCSPRDNFCRREGRRVADSRRKSAPLSLLVLIHRDEEGRADFADVRTDLRDAVCAAVSDGRLPIPGKFPLYEVY